MIDISDKAREQLFKYAASGDWDIIVLIDKQLRGYPVFRFRHSWVRKGAKLGYPVLAYINEKDEMLRVDLDDYRYILDPISEKEFLKHPDIDQQVVNAE